MQHAGIVALAQKYERTVSQILIRWSVQKGYAPLPKTTKVERLIENMGGWGLED